MFTLIIGGSASGKSRLAEDLVTGLSGERIYLATMEAWDEECRQRIARHRKMRLHKGFATVECSRGLARRVEEGAFPEDGNVLLEDLGNLLSGEMFGEGGSGPGGCLEAVAAGVLLLRSRVRHLTVVSNEVFSGGMSYAGETEKYMEVLGALHRIFAAEADRVLEVSCGIPKVWKGKRDESFEKCPQDPGGGAVDVHGSPDAPVSLG